MEIPVYGLSGIDGLASKLSTAAAAATAAHGGAVHGAQRATRRYGSFERYLSNIQNPRLRSIKADKHYSELRGLEGVFKVTGKKITEGKATVQEKADFNKASVLITLADTDYDAYRLASIYMPYVVDIDPDDGGYIFPSLELAQIAAVGEEQFIAYCNNPACTEYGKQVILDGLWDKIKKAASNVGKSIVNAGKAAVNSVANVAKATANTVKATAQLVTGNAKGAGETMKKAGQQFLSAHVDPVKTAVQDTVTMVKDSIDIFKETINIAGKVFKVLFIKINPVTVMIRNSWRGLLAINFLGMATRLGVGLMSWGDAEKAGYSYDVYNKAVNAVNKAKKMYKKMGGDADKLVKSIKNGANKKALFKKDLTPTTKLNFANTDDGETTLGELITIATMIAACAGIITSVWSWVKDIIAMKKQSNAEKEAKQQQEAAEQKAEEQRKYNAEHYEVDANGNPIVDQYGRPVPKGTIDADRQAALAAQQPPQEEETDTKKIILFAAIGAAAVFGGAMLMGGKPSKKRR